MTTTQQTFEITKKWNTLNDFYNSDEIKELYEEYEHVLRDNFKFLKREGEFICGIISEGVLYEAIKIDGVRYFGRVSISKAITNRKFGIAKIEGNELTLITDCFLSNDSTRRMARKSFPENVFLTKVII